jgi:hypothetical protein
MYLRNLSVLNSIVVSKIILLLLVMPISDTFAVLIAHYQGSCDKELSQAEEKYVVGKFDEAIELITQCLKKDDIGIEENQRALRLITLINIAKGYEQRAKETIKKLLDLVPNYKPDPVKDPPPFVELVERMKAETLVSITQEKEKDRGISKWWWIGGGILVAGGVAAAIIISGGDKDNGPIIEDLPVPPDLPSGN